MQSGATPGGAGQGRFEKSRAGPQIGQSKASLSEAGQGRVGQGRAAPGDINRSARVKCLSSKCSNQLTAELERASRCNSTR